MLNWLNGRRFRAGMRWLSMGLVAGFAFVVAGCSLQSITVEQTADVLWQGQSALEGESDPQFAREALPANLKTVETFLASSPDNEKLLRILAKGYFSYAFAFLEGDLIRMQAAGADDDDLDAVERRAVTHYMNSHRYGLRLLDDPSFEQAVEDLDLPQIEQLLGQMDQEDVPGLFWTAYGWGSAANLAQGDTDMIAALPIVEAIMERTVELDPRFFYSGAHLFFGVYYGSRPPMYGGNAERAKEHFEEAMSQHGDKNMLVRAMYARYYATAPGVQDRELFNRLLDEVLEEDLGDHPDVRLNNEVAKRRAQFWLERADDLFY